MHIIIARLLISYLKEKTKQQKGSILAWPVPDNKVVTIRFLFFFSISRLSIYFIFKFGRGGGVPWEEVTKDDAAAATEVQHFFFASFK